MIFDKEQLGRIEAQRRESPEVEKLIAERNQLLKDHPHLKKLQEEVDELLGTTVDPVIRLEILFMLMSDRLMEMRTVFAELVKLTGAAAVVK